MAHNLLVDYGDIPCAYGDMKRKSLRAILSERGLKHNWVAARIGVTQSHFSEMVRGTKRFPAEKIEPLAQVLALPVEEIVRAVVQKEVA